MTYFNLKEVAKPYPTPLQAVRALGSSAVSGSWCKVAVSSFPYKYKDFVEVNEIEINHVKVRVPRVNVDAYVTHELETLDLSVLTPQIHHQLLELQRAPKQYKYEMRYFPDNHSRNHVPF